jgi:nitronate monooxygenase
LRFEINLTYVKEITHAINDYIHNLQEKPGDNSMKNITSSDPDLTQKLTQKLTVLLEAERAGVVTARRMLAECSREEERALLERILEGERESCRDLGRMLLHIGSKGSGNVGDFADKVMALPDLSQRMELLVKGQQWVVRKIEELMEGQLPPGIAEKLGEVHRVHVDNVELCIRFLEKEQWVTFSH